METLKTMPDTFSAEILIDRLLVIDKIEKGLEDVKNGKTFNMNESKELASKWLK
jgi:predicted transcriptional regulator